jgi:hypothetical protein
MLYYRSGCVGCEVLAERKNCWCNTAELRAYLVWQRGGHTFAKFLDCCNNHPAAASSPDGIDFFFQHRLMLEEGPRYFREIEQHNKANPGKVRFLPPSPVHGEVRYVHLWVRAQEYEAEHTASSFDAGSDAGEPWAFPWRQRQRQWLRLLEYWPIAAASTQP